jgi:hypothetical protein
MAIIGGADPSDTAMIRPMRTISDSQAGEGQALALVPTSAHPWYMTPPAITDRRELEDEHTRILAQAVGDHVPYELALRAASIAEQLQHCA